MEVIAAWGKQPGKHLDRFVYEVVSHGSFHELTVP